MSQVWWAHRHGNVQHDSGVSVITVGDVPYVWGLHSAAAEDTNFLGCNTHWESSSWCL